MPTRIGDDMDRNLAFENFIAKRAHIHWADNDLGRIAKRFGVTDPLRAIEERQVRPIPGVRKKRLTTMDASRPAYTFVISNSEVDRHGDKIATSGWQLDNFKRNAVVLWGHNSDQLPIGRATSIDVAGGKLHSTMQFAAGRYAQTVEQAVRTGTVNATSVGFRPIYWDWSKDRKNGIDFHSAELLEYSLVSVPANASCTLVGMSDPTSKSWRERRCEARERTLEVVKLRSR
jgi:HK97 family phage prohead protease